MLENCCCCKCNIVARQQICRFVANTINDKGDDMRIGMTSILETWNNAKHWLELLISWGAFQASKPTKLSCFLPLQNAEMMLARADRDNYKIESQH